MQDGGVEVLVSRSVSATARIGLADAPGAVNEDLVETALVGLVGGFVAEVPFAENAGGVAGRLENLGDGRSLERQPLALEDGVRDAVLELMPAGHEGRARRRTGRADVKIGETHALVVQPVEIGRFQNRVAVTRQIAVALVIGQNKNDIGRLMRACRGCSKSPPSNH